MLRPGYWILDEERRPHEVGMMTWARWFEEQRRRGEHDLCIIKRTHFPDGSWVSSVFLGLDHNFYGAGPPILFETMIFSRGGGPSWDYQKRFRTLEEALAGHEQACALVRAQTAREPEEDLD